MIVCVYMVMGLLVLTKLCDVISTLRRIRHAHGETNPLARHLMLRMGIMQATWLVFLAALGIISLSGIAALTGGLLMQGLFVFGGTAVSVVQAAVAHGNWTGRESPITKYVRMMHRALQRVLPK